MVHYYNKKLFKLMFKNLPSWTSQIRYTKDKCIIVFILNEFTVQVKLISEGGGWMKAI